MPLCDPCIVGIDPGRSGALVALSITGDVITHAHQPLTPGKEEDLPAMWRLLKTLSPIHVAAIERVHGGPSMGGSSIMVMCRNAGIWIGLCHGMDAWNVMQVQPQEWQWIARNVTETGDKPWSKSIAVKAALQLFPTLNGALKFKKDWGIADAALIAEWARRKLRDE